MSAIVLSIGTELTRGELRNGNAVWLAEQLTLLGFEVLEIATLPDDAPRIAEALGRWCSVAGDAAASRHTPRVIVSTGGLGPTTDDLTAQAAALALGVELERNPDALAQVQERYRRRGRTMPASNLKQAELPRGSTVLPNELGTAPGFCVELGQVRVFFLPGVPSEMRQLFETQVKPRIAGFAPRDQAQIHLRAFGMTESGMADRLAGLEQELEGVTFGYRASFPEIEVKLLARGRSFEHARQRAEHAAARVRERLGDAVYGGREDSFAASVGSLLVARGLTVASAESCTGGRVGSLLSEAPGSSKYFLLSVVTYSNAAKRDVLGVPATALEEHGAVSAPVAEAMAEGVLRLAASDVAVSVTGIAGPEGGSDAKPVGTVWFGVARRGGASRSEQHRFHGDRGRIRKAAAYRAVALLRAAAQAHPALLRAAAKPHPGSGS